ncbi:MAG: transglycosylase SLT domain-containing protein [Desulfobulbaceae bacterium]|nr:transglycosylase SLT domain-containing protein [Desulfobulbaceae bacterium]
MRVCFLKPFFAALLFLALAPLSLPAVAGEVDPFPAYDCLRPNVEFWEKIYSRYSLNEGVIHDSNDLAVVYGVIELAGESDPDAARINRERSQAAKVKYREILMRLAAGEPAVTTEEQRVLALFGGAPSPATLARAAQSVRMQRGQMDRFKEGLIRSGAYLETFKEEFRSQGLPEDLAYLAHVESSFNVHAYSKVGAAGVWQFTRQTGKRFMRVDEVIDERRDPFAATRAAVLYLKQNHQQLGSWPVAITAYNHGEYGMARALVEKGDYETIFREYESPLFGFASRNFYSEFLAARLVAGNYRRYFGELAFHQPQRFFEFELAGFASLAGLADHFRIDLEELARLNPALLPPLVSGQQLVPPGYRLRLPERQGRMRQLARALPGDFYRVEQQPSFFYEVRRGDTASLIASRHNVPLAELVAANRLDDRGTVHLGQNLSIPVAADARTPVTETPVAAGEKSGANRAAFATLAGSAKVEVSKAPEGVASPPAATTGEEAGASGPVVVRQAVASGQLKVEAVRGKGGKRYGLIRVAAGETLGHYAEWLEVHARDLRRLNHLRFGSVIRPGQRLKIPLAKVAPARFEKRRVEFHKSIREDIFAGLAKSANPSVAAL